jgi:hypothetical protein
MSVISKVEIKKSTIPNAGRGVFAKVDISIGEIPCYYDGYIKNAEECSDEELIYLVGNDLVGYKNPKTDVGIAQIINDYSMVKLDNFPKDKFLLERVVFVSEQVKQYIMHVKTHCNILCIEIDNKYTFKSYKK